MEHLPTRVAVTVLSLVDPTKWGSRLAIANRLAVWPEGMPLADADAAHWAGISVGRSRQLVKELGADRVAIRALAGPKWRRLNPDVFAWRAVPWRVDRRELRARIEAALHEEHARAVAELGETEIARLWRAIYPQNRAAMSRGFGGDQPPKTSKTARHGPRDPGAAPGENRAAWPRGFDGPSRGPAPFTGSREPSDCLSEQPADDLHPDSDEVAFIQAAGALMRRYGGYVSGDPERQLRHLVAEHGLAAVLEAMAARPPNGSKAPVVVPDLARILAAAEVPAGDGGASGCSRCGIANTGGSCPVFDDQCPQFPPIEREEATG